VSKNNAWRPAARASDNHSDLQEEKFITRFKIRVSDTRFALISPFFQAI